jgi:hypothetical protein
MPQKKFEYFILSNISARIRVEISSSPVNCTSDEALVKILDRLGVDGWECCDMGQDKALLKREILDSEFPPIDRSKPSSTFVIDGFEAKGPLFGKD